jgi:diguanylate cyclase (GGDEF)-like protein
MVRAHHNEQLAMRDPLTGLANRRSFEQDLSTELAQPDPDCAVLLLDLDGFKAINDTWGHDVGDKVLVTVAERLRTTVRNTDVVARIGGDEFAVLARPAHQADVLRERLSESIGRPMPVAGVLLHPSASIGSAPVLAGATQSEVLREADHGLYQVKRSRPTSGRRLGARQASQ